MAKVVIIGAGSGFGSRLSIDILSRPPLQDTTIALCDIDTGRLSLVRDYIQRAIDHHNLPAKVIANKDRRTLLAGADVVITSISVGGSAYSGFPYKAEIEIPQKYGVDQRIGDTVGPGGIFRFLRTGPVQLEICKDMERLCPDALLLNYTNPMCMLTWMHSAGSKIRNVGLCHSIQWTIHELCGYIGEQEDQVDYWVAGINHQAWVLSMKRNGKDLYPKILKAMQKPDVYAKDHIRFEMLKHLGYFVTESSMHNSEYVPYFRRDAKLRRKYKLESKVVLDKPRAQREWMKQTGGDNAGASVPELKRSNEYASGIIEAVITGNTLRFNGNVMNTNLITNLPQNCCVEVPCLADKNGVHPCFVGELPAQCAAINRTNVSVQELAVQAVLAGDRQAAFHACMLDPLTAASADLDQIRAMFDEMWKAEKKLLKFTR